VATVHVKPPGIAARTQNNTKRLLHADLMVDLLPIYGSAFFCMPLQVLELVPDPEHFFS
jgi:hypothetical protein